MGMEMNDKEEPTASTSTSTLTEEELEELTPFCRCEACTSWFNLCNQCYGCLGTYDDRQSPQYVIDDTRAFKKANPDFVKKRERRNLLLSIFTIVFTVVVFWIFYDEKQLERQENFFKALFYAEDTTPYDTPDLGNLIEYPFMKGIYFLKLGISFCIPPLII